MVTSHSSNSVGYDIEKTVLDRYQEGAKVQQPSLCCPTEYEGNYLEILPQEIIEKDYGCGDPTRYVDEGETVLDLGSGTGKNCYILAKKVGKTGQVIGVDFNDEMLKIARKYQQEIANKIGTHNTKFIKGKIQDLTLDLDLVESWLRDHPIQSVDDLSRFESECDRLRKETPLVADDSIDVVISNCVLNLVKPDDKQQLFEELYRVLKRGGRAVISDIVCDEDPTENIFNDPDLWSGCIAGAFREDEFLKMFEKVGFYGVEILKREETPWQVIDGVEFRSMTIRAYKGKEGPCLERKQSIIYKGPWKQVQDDDGHIFCRGERMAVCDKTYHILTRAESPYQADIIGVPPYQEIPLEEATEFSCKNKAIRHPKETKGSNYHLTEIKEDMDCCTPGECC
ncbi:putative methyltransferase [Crocosphaera subtropica ATCC 51142]|uniref:Arsenite methyltransferase n=1 Tax=Crocosphaera subtropica (strain ATCC 51142 / BH68) TaxID=43989 RepID=B1WSR4_CROS5|nr:methyltransferase domain-containing protein [Crocosphaera subtropica]ACB53643.1 putative methyltransferase [Crocosphaera subtropica ATCC 51142]